MNGRPAAGSRSAPIAVPSIVSRRLFAVGDWQPIDDAHRRDAGQRTETRRQIGDEALNRLRHPGSAMKEVRRGTSVPAPARIPDAMSESFQVAADEQADLDHQDHRGRGL